MDTQDIIMRALKTFAQAFFGVLIPVLVTYLNQGWPESWDAVWVVFAPALAAALAAGISAAWNTIMGKLNEGKSDEGVLAEEE